MLRQTYALTVRELKHWYRVKIQIFMTLIQPLFWLLLFGQAFIAPGDRRRELLLLLGGGHALHSDAVHLHVLRMSIVWDRRFGFLNKLRASPIERGVIPTSRGPGHG